MAWAPDYATVDDVAAAERINDALDDVQIALAISTASRMIDHTTNRQFGQCDAAEVRYFTACGWTVEIDDLMTATGLAIASDYAADWTYSYTLSTTYAGLRPSNAAAKGKPWTSISILPTSPVFLAEGRDAIRVTARWGWTAVPETIRQATVLQASRLLARRDAPFGVAGSPETGSEVRLLARLDPDVAVAVAPYRRWWGAV